MPHRMKKKPFNLILLGDPASGKGTQAARLVKKYHFYDLDMGRELRKPAVRARFDYAKTTAIGKLTPTTVVHDIFKNLMHEIPLDQSILFNGTPKMIGEAKLVETLLRQYERTDPMVIYLSLPAHEISRRIEKRWELTMGKLVKRDDDTERALKNRRKYYKEHISHVVAFFEKEYTVKRISGMGTEAEVEKKIVAALEQYKKKNI
jgi:adenylate kinase family enzyme